MPIGGIRSDSNPRPVGTGGCHGGKRADFGAEDRSLNQSNRPTRRRFLALGAACAATAWDQCPSWALDPGAWTDCRTHAPFICRADFRLDAYTPLFQELVLLQRELIRTLAIVPAQTPIEVYLFHARTTYESYVRQLYPEVPYRRALFVKSGPWGRVFAYRDADLPVDLRHECTHALVHASQPMVPLWLDEGLAEYFEPPPAQRAFENPHLATLRWNLRLGMIPSLSDLEAKFDMAEMGSTEYRFAWAWAHFMLHGPVAAHRELVQFLADTRLGKPPGRLGARLARVVPDLSTRFVQHFKYWKRIE